MGKLKGLLPWKGVTLFEHQLMTLEKSSVEEIIVVVSSQAEEFMKLAKYFPVRMEFIKKVHSGNALQSYLGFKL